MSETEQGATGAAGLRRGIHLLPHLFTVGNLFAGYFSISAAVAGDFDRAAIAIGFGFVLDSLDGSVARIVRSDSAIGVQLDSLADVVTFGMAASLLAYLWGVESVVGGNAALTGHLHRIGWIAAFAYLVATALRLARFNVLTAEGVGAAKLPRGDHVFTGMPTPTGAACVAVPVHFFKEPILSGAWSIVWIVVLAVVAVMMVSRVRFPNIRSLVLGGRAPHVRMLIVALFIAAVYYYSEIVLLTILAMYLGGVVLYNLRWKRTAD